MIEGIQLIDIADELVILNKNTIDSLYRLDNCSDCIALYIFYYKLAKWQKTDTIKANDTYVQKCLKWGTKKIINTKNTLKQNGLIEIVQRRKENKIDGWYIKIHYLISKDKINKVITDDQELSKQELSKATSSFQETNALRINNKCLKKEIEMLKEENNKLKSLLKENQDDIESSYETSETYREIIDYMNTVHQHEKFINKVEFSYRPNSKATQKLINARLREGYNVEEFKDVIWWGYRKFVQYEFETQTGESSYKYFRPSTLFSSEHFEEYLNEYRAFTQ